MIADPDASWSAPLLTVASNGWRPAVANAFAQLQAKAMKEKFPDFRAVLDLPWVTIWEGELTPVSQPYRVRIVDHRGMDDGRIAFGGFAPSVRVLSPLTRRGEEPHLPVPHLYGDHDNPRGPQLCLFHPLSHDWNDYMLLADSIVPWSAEWLFYYEMWHVTGSWGGEEASHDTPVIPVPTSARSARTRSLRAIDEPVMRCMPYLIP
ncbi:hypothetical protein [uncultured Sphingomonas sp.]|uniref:hypothetical protein n=1 Tax=uncultured Sphingomonas sp. TaxID=158754 RepID=UPI0026199E9F|nr:hypothetical protein [uncultured Sphingomonas sp.]